MKKQFKITIKSKYLLVPMILVAMIIIIALWISMSRPDYWQKSESLWMDFQDRLGFIHIPEEFIPIYMEAETEYNVPWTLLAAHHRIETRFSKMNPLLSPAGAEGHMQFMPCTFVGWGYPGCTGLGKGEIPEEDKTDPAVIEQYGGYGVDANGDGIADPFDIKDAIFSTANYLAASGAAEGDIEKAIFEYNRSEQYVEDVLWYYHKFEEDKRAIEAAFVK